ncbi:hypothetical protein LshimejAT787_1200040 [Lyophyllum shimeji]|uniref:Uncharacterized protein n=1 Tax=Lyophyllum shimeji TaxID=47721 RepID=A0A9P3PTH6_LYOSH|nr:hypothetical protein LshimejAT787_1200040 [Lyophyllum shimeji]
MMLHPAKSSCVCGIVMAAMTFVRPIQARSLHNDAAAGAGQFQGRMDGSRSTRAGFESGDNYYYQLIDPGNFNTEISIKPIHKFHAGRV